MIGIRIKHPNSDNAARDLCQLLSSAKKRFKNCIQYNHDVIALLYISSLIISPSVMYNDIRLLDEIHNIVNSSPRNFICLVRTTAPSYFRGNMKTLQKRAIDFLRDKCYTVVYDPKHEFLNHAKFAIYYQICNTENIIYYRKYYGSTNLTVVGLSYRRGTRSIGNYEEYTVTDLRSKFMLSNSDKFYLNEVLELITHKAFLYTNRSYLRKYLSTHLTYMEQVLHNSRKIYSEITLGGLYSTYIDLAVVYNQTYALLDEIPGKKLTEKLVARLMKIKPPINIFELEMLIPKDEKHSEILAKDLGLEHNELRKMIKEYKKNVEGAYKLIRSEYMPILKEINNYFDSTELKFIEFIKFNNKLHRDSLIKAIKIRGDRDMKF